MVRQDAFRTTVEFVVVVVELGEDQNLHGNNSRESAVKLKLIDSTCIEQLQRDGERERGKEFFLVTTRRARDLQVMTSDSRELELWRRKEKNTASDTISVIPQEWDTQKEHVEIIVNSLTRARECWAGLVELTFHHRVVPGLDCQY